MVGLCLYLLASLILYKRYYTYYHRLRRHSSRCLSSRSLPLNSEWCSSVDCLKLRCKVSYSPVIWITRTYLKLQHLLNCADFFSYFLRVNWNSCQFLPTLPPFYRGCGILYLSPITLCLNWTPLRYRQSFWTRFLMRDFNLLINNRRVPLPNLKSIVTFTLWVLTCLILRVIYCVWLQKLVWRHMFRRRCLQFWVWFSQCTN